MNQMLGQENGNGEGRGEKGEKGGGASLVQMLLSNDESDESWTERGTEMGIGCGGRKKTI